MTITSDVSTGRRDVIAFVAVNHGTHSLINITESSSQSVQIQCISKTKQGASYNHSYYKKLTTIYVMYQTAYLHDLE